METAFDLKKIKRTPTGFVVEKSVDLLPLLNYPVCVEMTPAAIQKMDLEFKEHDNVSQVDIYLNFKSGIKWHLFSVNTNFFGRVQGDRNSNSPVLKYTVGTFEYDPSDHSYRFDCFMERSLGISSKDFSSLKLSPNDVMVSFSATYSVGYFGVLKQTEFLVSSFEDSNAPEALLLKIDTYLLDSPKPEAYSLERRDETGPRITLNHLSLDEQRKMLHDRYKDVRDKCVVTQKH